MLKTLQLHIPDQRHQLDIALPPNLVSLHLSCLALAKETCQSIQLHDKLRQIRLTGCVFSDTHPPFATKWKSYGLYHTDIKVLPALIRSSLQTLELVDCNLDDTKIDVSNLPMGLKSLNLSHNDRISTQLISNMLLVCRDLECLQMTGMKIDLSELSVAVSAHYSLTNIITDAEIPCIMNTYLRLNQAGRRYLQKDPTSFHMTAQVLGDVSYYVNDIYTHLLEMPSICKFVEKR